MSQNFHETQGLNGRLVSRLEFAAPSDLVAEGAVGESIIGGSTKLG